MPTYLPTYLPLLSACLSHLLLLHLYLSTCAYRWHSCTMTCPTLRLSHCPLAPSTSRTSWHSWRAWVSSAFSSCTTSLRRQHMIGMWKVTHFDARFTHLDTPSLECTVFRIHTLFPSGHRSGNVGAASPVHHVDARHVPSGDAAHPPPAEVWQQPGYHCAAHWLWRCFLGVCDLL